MRIENGKFVPSESSSVGKDFYKNLDKSKLSKEEIEYYKREEMENYILDEYDRLTSEYGYLE